MSVKILTKAGIYENWGPRDDKRLSVLRSVDGLDFLNEAGKVELNRLNSLDARIRDAKSRTSAERQVIFRTHKATDQSRPLAIQLALERRRYIGWRRTYSAEQVGKKEETMRAKSEIDEMWERQRLRKS